MVYWDKQSNGAAATVANLLAGTDINEFRNLQQTGRFRTLHDKIYTLSATAGSGNGTTSKFGKQVRRFKVNKNVVIPLTFDGNAGAITDLTTNNLGVMVISESSYAYIKYKWRLRFSDF